MIQTVLLGCGGGGVTIKTNWEMHDMIQLVSRINGDQTV